jgi:hypothetical protein
MTRIGRCKIGDPVPCWQCVLRRDNLAPLKIFQTKRPSTLTLPDPQAFLKWHSGVGYIWVKRYTAHVQLASVRWVAGATAYRPSLCFSRNTRPFGNLRELRHRGRRSLNVKLPVSKLPLPSAWYIPKSPLTEPRAISVLKDPRTA